MNQTIVILLLLVPAFAAQPGPAAETGGIEGKVVLADTGEALPGATVRLMELGLTAQTNAEGRYRFDQVPPGAYRLTAHVSATLRQVTREVTVTAGKTAICNFELGLAVVRQEVTVTASGRPQTAFEAFQSVETRNSFELAEEIAPSIGETLAGKPGNGVAKRSFGPGSDRPIIRGFDGDRVLVMQDGIRTGTLSSQSGDHGELVDIGNLDEVEIVKGPATLLYGGSAVGGVVNMISRHHAVHEHPHQGLRGHIGGSAGSANGFASGSAGFEYGRGKWMLWAGGGGQDSGEYATPQGKIPDSDTRLRSGYGGFGRYGERMFFSAGVTYGTGVYGVPFAAQLEAGTAGNRGGDIFEESDAERVQLEAQRRAYQFNWGVKNPACSFENFALRLNYTRWRHDEIEVLPGAPRRAGTSFDNKQFIYRGVFEQRKWGPLTGRFGFWGLLRDYNVAGEEALSPPVDQQAVAGFALEELDFESYKLQLGVRVEHNDYKPAPATGAPIPEIEPLERSFTGVSAAAGVHVGLWNGGAFVVNYSRSYRPPALEELYNQGPHVGNLAWEVGNPRLNAETGNGIDLSLRHQQARLRGEWNFFDYGFSNFIFPYATGEIRDGLQVIAFTHADSRYWGTEASLALGVRRDLWVQVGADYVNAEETQTGIPLPRIPPLRGRLGIEFRHWGLRVEPELILAGRQDRTFPGETPTAGYAVVNLTASYVLARGRLIHQFAVNTFNLTDRLYRNHSSFIKHLAPEIGRGVRFTYRLRFF